MKSGKIFVLVFLLPIVKVKTGAFDFFNVFYEQDVLRPFDSNEFEKDLRRSLYGQHIALESILKAVCFFMKDPNPSKPLVLSLHGNGGVGKTYVTKIIARNIYKMGEKSKHVHTFLATYDFPQKTTSGMYEDQLKQWVLGNVTSFPHSMFIFDEMDKMDSHLVNTMKPFLDYVPHVGGVSFQNAIFIFISNSAGNLIKNLTLELLRKGKEREDLQMNTEAMESQIYQHIFNDKDSGFWHSALLNHHLVDHFIPFLPLEMEHVQQCVLAEITNLNIREDDYPDLVDTVVAEMLFSPMDKVFSHRGCKSVKSKLGQHIKL